MENKLCFVIMGYGKKTDYSTGNTYDLDKTYNNVIKPVAEKCGYTCVRADEIKDSAIIDKSMYGLLLYADLVIADISTYNPNVIYELGVRHALRPFYTIIMKEKEGTLPFDLSHNRIFNYSHLGDDIGVDESKRCVSELTGLINAIKNREDIDSPFYEFISSVEPPKISKLEIETLINELAKNHDSLFAIVEEANILKKQDNFKEAAEYWKKASEKMPNEPYYIQQEALCTYKSKYPSENLALTNASIIINKLITSEETYKNDPETLGIAGAIYKNMYFNNKDEACLDKAIEYYGAGFNSRKDYYNGENYALCLNIKSSISKNDEKIYYRIQAKKVREEMVENLTKIIKFEEFKQRDDKKWIYATLANCYFAINNEEKASQFEEKFKDEYDEEWQLNTYFENKNILVEILGEKFNE